MSEAAKTLMQAVMELPEAERLKIADTVYESLQDHSTLSEDDPGLNAILQQRLRIAETITSVPIVSKLFFDPNGIVLLAQGRFDPGYSIRKPSDPNGVVHSVALLVNDAVGVENVC